MGPLGKTFVAVACLTLLSSPGIAGSGDRYDVKPLTDLPANLMESSGIGSQGFAAGDAEAPPKFILRHVEGLESAPKQFASPEARTIELGDPFGRLLISTPLALPDNITKLLELVDTLNSDPTASGSQEPLDDQTVYLVSESGQISVSEAPDLRRRARAIILRRDARANDAVFVAPSMRTDGQGTLEVMAWDPGKKRFNYYKRTFSPDGQPVWLWKGDSAHAWSGRTRNGGCFVCHRNGEPVMKELRQPWQNWHSEASAIKAESLPDDSPLKTNPLFSLDAGNVFLRKGEELELAVNQWIVKLNRSRIELFNDGQLSARMLMEPFFRTTTINLTSSTEPSETTGDRIPIPWSFFYNNIALSDVGELCCDVKGAFGETVPTIDRATYRDILSQLGFKLEDPGSFEKSPADTHFAFLTPEPAKTEGDLMLGLVNRGVISRRLAATLLLIDVPNPVYSPVREALFAIIPDWKKEDVAAEGLEPKLVERFRVLHESGEQPPLVAEGLDQFFRLWDSTPETWEADACAHVEDYLRNVGTRWKTGKTEPYFKLLGARRETFFSSDHGELKESEILFPRSETDQRLIMHFDGSVGIPD